MANYCFETLGTHELLQCDDWLTGGISAFALLETDATLADYTAAADWNTAIAADEAVVIKNIKGEYPEATEATVDSEVGCGPESILSGFDHVFNFTDPNVSADNDTLYEDVNGRSLNLVMYNCSEQKIYVVELDCRPVVKPPIHPSSNKEFRKYVGRVEWSSTRNVFPVEFAAPTGIFEDA